jgi:tRNA(Ile)-lysidine synthase TilS/MesJ
MVSIINKYEKIEKKLPKEYRKTIWSKYIKAIKEYNLLNENDKILIIINNTSSSILNAICLKKLQEHSLIPFKIEYCYEASNQEDKVNIQKNITDLNINITILEENTDIFEIIKHLNCNKISLSDNKNDVVKDALNNLFFNKEIKAIMPKNHLNNIEIIRPMYLIEEEDIKLLFNSTDLEFIKNNNLEEIESILKELQKNNSKIINHIFASLSNVNLETVLGYKENNVYHSFKEWYNKIDKG